MLDLKNFSTWKEANRWLAKHGFGMAQIEEIKKEWDSLVVEKATPVTEKTPAATTIKPTPITKPAVTTKK
jgi:hypothetical protein